MKKQLSLLIIYMYSFYGDKKKSKESSGILKTDRFIEAQAFMGLETT